MTNHDARETSFIGRLEELRESGDRGALAALRRGLGKPLGTVVAMHPIVAPFTKGLKAWPEDAYYLVATLYATHPEGCNHGTFGTTVGAIAAARADGRASLEKRFLALLDADVDGLSNHLRQLVALARSANKPINWSQLLHDLVRWDSMDRWVQRQWARDFYQGKPESDTQTASATPAEEPGTEGGR